MTTIAETAATSFTGTVNGSDLVWIWQNGELKATDVSSLIAAYYNTPDMADGTIKSNITGGGGAVADNTVSDIFDHVFSDNVGSIFYRGPTGWKVLDAGINGYALTSGGPGADLVYAPTGLAEVAPSTVLANVTGGAAVPSPVSVPTILDLLGSTRGSILYRGASGWTVLSPGTVGQALASAGAGADPLWASLPGTGTVTSVALSGGSTGLTFTGPITTNGTITLSGTLSIANGGTGAGTVPGAQAALGISYYTKQAVTAASTSLSIDLSLGGTVALALNSNVSVAFAVTNWPASGTMGRLLLEITSSGAYNITAWPGTVTWVGGAVPTITSSGKDTILLTSHDGGSTFRGYIVAQAMS